MSNHTCIDCDGTGERKLMYPVGDGIKPLTLMGLHLAVYCDRCNGSGTIPDHMLEWINIGESCRFHREEEEGIGLRDWASIQGMKPSQLSRLESGKEDPTEYARRIGVIE